MSALEEVLKAWRDPGPHPLYHRRAQADLRKTWPALYKALVALDEEEDANAS